MLFKFMARYTFGKLTEGRTGVVYFQYGPRSSSITLISGLKNETTVRIKHIISANKFVKNNIIICVKQRKHNFTNVFTVMLKR